LDAPSAPVALEIRGHYLVAVCVATHPFLA
jgi:hypothetical protein